MVATLLSPLWGVSTSTLGVILQMPKKILQVRIVS
jgi:hypothetical protein